MLHDEVGLGRVQAAAGRAALLQERGVVADPHLGLRREHALQQLREQFLRQLPRGIEIAAGRAPREQRVEVVAGHARERDARTRVADRVGFRRRRPEHLAHLGRGFGLAVLHVPDRVRIVPSGEGVQRRRQRVPVRVAQALVAFALRGVRAARADRQPRLQQATQRRPRLGRELGAGNPAFRAEHSEQFAFVGIDLDLLAQVRRQRDPAPGAREPIAAGEQRGEVEGGVFPRFEVEGGAAADAHGFGLVERGATLRLPPLPGQG